MHFNRNSQAAIVALVCSAAALSGCMASPWRSLAKATAESPDGLRVNPPLIRGQLVIDADFNLPTESLLIEELVAEQQLISDCLGTPPGDGEIYIHLFAKEEAYRQCIALRFPTFSHRRAIFVESGGELHVYAHWSDRVGEDLRHEVAHGYLHGIAPNLPLWLDEGLAEYFEVGDGGRGRHTGHIEHLRHLRDIGAWRPSIERLEAQTSASEMSQTDYAEAWLWVHYLLHASEKSRAMLADHLSELRQHQSAAPLSVRIRGDVPNADAALVGYLTTLAG